MEREGNGDSSEPSDDDSESSPAVMTFPTVGAGAKTWHLRQADVQHMQADYPGLDVLAECRKAHAWIRANDSKRKTAKGMRAFLVNWLNRSTNGGNGTRAAPAAKPFPPLALRHDWREECQRLHNSRCGSPTFHAAQMDRDAEEAAS